MCSLVRYHVYLFCQFLFAKYPYFLNPFRILALAPDHLLCCCIKYQIYQNIYRVIFPTGLNNCFAAPLRMRLCLIYVWRRIFSIEECLAMDTLSKSISIYFPKSNSSLLKGIRLQGLFSRGEFIPTQKNLPPGIIFPSRIHPYTKESASRDYFPGVNSSLLRRICLQGLFFRDKFIPTQKNSPPGMLWEYRRSPPNPRKQFQDAWRLETASG